MTRTLLLAAIVAASAPARAEDAPDTSGSFEAKAAGAIRVHHLENLVWALTTPCEAGDDVQQRQCRQVRDARAAELANATLLIDADGGALEVGAWNQQKKSVPFTLSACIRCAGVEVDGKTWFVAGTAAPPRFDGGKLKVGQLHENARLFKDAAAAKEWIKSVGNAKVQLLVKVPAKPRWIADGKAGLGLDVVGFRVFTPCDGGIVCASPKATPVDADKKQCQIASGTAEPPVVTGPSVDALTPSMVQDGMKPVLDAAQACFEKLGVTGSAKLKLTIAADGSVSKHELIGSFTATPTGECIEKAIPSLHFQRSKKPSTTVSYPIQLQ